MTKVIELFTTGEVKTQDKIFTRLVGGFDEGNPVISDLQIANLLEYKKGARAVRQLLSENIKYFQEGLHILDVKKGVVTSNTLKETLISLGYSKQSLNLSQNIYVFNQDGFNLYLQLADVKDDFSEFEEQYFGKSNTIYFNPLRYENSFGKILTQIFDSVINFEKQYPCCTNKYFIDFYSKEYSLAIEYDEMQHIYSFEEDKVREKEIFDELNCHFIRVKKGEESKGLNEIFKYILKRCKLCYE